MKKSLPFTIPHWRYGQTFFNFCEWLQEKKGWPPGQNYRMADTFHIPDKEFEKLWEEFQEKMQPL